jgi:hypothetical protein
MVRSPVAVVVTVVTIVVDGKVTLMLYRFLLK